jgi:hypothetical protein
MVREDFLNLVGNDTMPRDVLDVGLVPLEHTVDTIAATACRADGTLRVGYERSIRLHRGGRTDHTNNKLVLRWTDRDTT